MGLAPYFRRSAVAAAQVLAGFDEEAIRSRLEQVQVGLAWRQDVVDSPEGRALLDLSIRLVSRLYPRLRLDGPDPDGRYEGLAREINPELELVDASVSHSVVLGRGKAGKEALNFFAGSDEWDALISTRETQSVGGSANPFGAGVAACLTAANLFRAVFVDDPELDDQLTFSTLDLDSRPTHEGLPLSGPVLSTPTVLVGAGAVGNAALWALGHLELGDSLHVVDPEVVEISNLQRYVLATIADKDRPKVDLATRAVSSARPHQLPWDEFAARHGHAWDRVLVALDTAGDRRQVQSSLPRWIANAWTQAGDLGISVHPWKDGACLSCLYLPKGEAPSEDELVASALGFNDDRHRSQIRQLLHSGQPPPPELLQESATALGIKPEKLLSFRNRPVRDLYVEGICGGAVLPLDRVGRPAEDVQVPLAHQSAMAGILLAARVIGDELGRGPESAVATRTDVMRAIGSHLTQPIAKDRRGICICQDPVYKAAWDEKYG